MTDVGVAFGDILFTK